MGCVEGYLTLQQDLDRGKVRKGKASGISEKCELLHIGVSSEGRACTENGYAPSMLQSTDLGDGAHAIMVSMGLHGQFSHSKKF